MRLVFIGASKFGLRCLEKIIGINGTDLAGVVTAPRQFSISYNPQGVTNVLHADVTSLCDAQGIPMAVINDGMKDDALFNKVKSWNPDLFVVAGWYHMVPAKWRELAPAYGLHASLLPDYSGGAPLVWAIINGERKTGITFFQFDDGVDSGPIVGQRETPIQDDDTIATVYGRIEDLGLELIDDCLSRLVNGTAILQEQDGSKRRLVPQRKPDDGLIDWNQSARRIHDFVRAQTKPYPGAFTFLNDKKITIWSGGVVSGSGLLPQESHITSNDIIFGCADGDAYRVTYMAVDGVDMEPAEYMHLKRATS